MAVSELPGNPNAVWTVRRHVEGMQYFPETQRGHNDFVCVLFVVVFLVFCPRREEWCCVMLVCHHQKLWFESAATCLS